VHHSRSNSLSAWNFIAMILFIVGIFFGVSIFGYSAVVVAIFMWVTGRMFINLFFGKPKKKVRVRSNNRRRIINPNQSKTNLNRNYKNYKFNGEHSDNYFCMACGSPISVDDTFCVECGTIIEGQFSNS